MDCGNSYCCLSAPGSYLGACIFGFHNFVRLRCCSARKPGRPCALVFIPNSRRLLLNASALSDAAFGGSAGGGRALWARLIKPFERGRPGLRQTRALWKFKCGKERRVGVPKPCCEAQPEPTWA